MSSSRIVLVFGATGLQGSSVVNALLKDGTFTPRSITRNPDSEAALKLKARGVQVVKGDAFDKASLVSAMRGSEAVFAMTSPDFPPKAEGPNELTQGKNMVDAAKEAGVKFFIFSGLPSIAKISAGKYKSCLHYDHKADIEAYLKASGLANATLYLGCFLENFWTRPLLTKTATGFDFSIPAYKATDLEAFTWVERDVPAATLALLKHYTNPAKNISGKSYPVVNATLSCGELAKLTSKAFGAEVTFTTGAPFGMPAVDEMWASHAEYDGLYTATPVPNPELVALGVQFGTVEEWLEAEVKPRFVSGQ